MINYIKGILTSIYSDYVVIETNNIGYEIFLCLRDINLLNDKLNKEIKVFIYLIHKDDSMNLYGFINEDDKKGFIELLKVDGVGPKLALKILSTYDIQTLFEYIENENVDMLKKISGIGPKIVNKLIFELKGKIPSNKNNENNLEKEIIMGLLNLGYEENKIREIIKLNKIETNNFELEFKRILKLVANKK